jgi:selenocysteine lyase/cysteine desulfurase
VTEAIIEAYRWISRFGYSTPDVYDEVPRRITEIRSEIARFVGADTDEIALLRNTTEGLNTVIRGLQWKQGDEVIVSDQENPAALLPPANLTRRLGVVVHRLRLSDDVPDLLSRLSSLITSNTRLIILSHVTHVTGLVLPLKEICDLSRKVGVPVLWDGAQALGQIPVDVHDAGCEFYSGCSYKWLLGPFGGGVLYVRRDWLDRLDTTDVGVGSQEQLDLESLRFSLKPTAQRFEYGARPWPIHVGMAAGMRIIQGYGVDAIRARMLDLVQYAREGLARLKGIVVLSSPNPERASGILTVAVPGLEARQVVRHMWDKHRVLVQWRHLPSWAPAPRGIRISLPFFITRHEIDRALEALQRTQEELMGR